MKKYIQKFSAINSTGKLIIFVVVLFAVILLASSSFYIQYRNRQPKNIAEVGRQPEVVTESKKQLSVVEASTVKPPVAPEHNTSSSSLQSQEAQAKNKQGKCSSQKIKHSITYKEAPWLLKGQIKVVPGKDGVIKKCGGSEDATVLPVDQVVYRGSRVLTVVPSLLDSVATELTKTPLLKDLSL